jgi:Ca2+-binding EF-hand superfamily protein
LFYETFQYNLKKLNCLGILLGQETIPRKLKILFQNYDSDTSGELSRDELLTMIDDITEVACIILPKGALAMNPGNKALQVYADEIASVRKSMIRQLLAAMIENKASITEREFNVSYQNDEGVRNLLSTKALREYCQYLKKNILGSVENIMKSLNEFNHHEEVRKILNFHSKAKKRLFQSDIGIQ